MKNHHKRRSMHRAAAFTQAQPSQPLIKALDLLINGNIASMYAETDDYIQKQVEEGKLFFDVPIMRRDSGYNLYGTVCHVDVRDRHPITLEKLDGE